LNTSQRRALRIKFKKKEAEEYRGNAMTNYASRKQKQSVI
jgi:hypothetical protein